MFAGCGEQVPAAETIEILAIFRRVAKILPTKRPPFWGPETDPKMEATRSVSIRFACVRTTWPPFWGPFLDTKTGAVLSANFLPPGEKYCKFRLFLQVRDRSFAYRWATGFPWFCSAASNCSPRPANVYAHTCS